MERESSIEVEMHKRDEMMVGKEGEKERERELASLSYAEIIEYITLLFSENNIKDMVLYDAKT